MLRITILFLCLIFSSVSFGQTKTNPDNLKSVVITEQKFDGTASKTYKDYEIYYDAKGNVIEEKIYKEGKIDSHFKYQYDANGNKIKETEFSSEGKVKKISDYKYQGNLRIEKTVYDDKGKIKSKKTYKYEKY